jgi:hypothetical protein
MTLLADLKAVRELISKGWSQKAAARGHGGVVELATSQNATAFCPFGAAMAVCKDSPNDETRGARLWAIRHAIQDACGRGCEAEWNDAPGRTKEQVLEMIGLAINRANNK